MAENACIITICNWAWLRKPEENLDEMNILTQTHGGKKRRSTHRLISLIRCITTIRHILDSEMLVWEDGPLHRAAINRSRGNSHDACVGWSKRKLSGNGTVCINSDASRIHGDDAAPVKVRMKLQFESSGENQLKFNRSHVRLTLNGAVAQSPDTKAGSP